MRRRKLKRYRQILAGFLAASLIISSMPANVQARSAYQEQTYTQIASQVENQDNSEYSDEVVDTDQGTTAPSDTEDMDNIQDGTTEGDPDIDDTEFSGTEEEPGTDNVSTEENSTEDAGTETPDADPDSEDVSTESPTTEEQGAEKVDDQSGEIDSGAEIAAQSGTLTLDDLAGNSFIEVTDDSITATSQEAMILISNLKPELLAGKNINIKVAGDADLTKTVEWNGNTYSYKSIGDETYPFEKKLSAGGAALKVNISIFGVVTSDAAVTASSIEWRGNDGSISVYADKYIFSDDGTHTINVPITSAGSDYIMGNFIGTVSGKAGTLEISNLSYGEAKGIVTQTSDAGLICNTLESGTIVLENCTLPTNSVGVTSDKGYAGGLIGYMKAETGLRIKLVAEQTISDMKVTSNAGSAGGLAGQMDKGALFELDGKLTLSKPVIQGEAKVGGIAGCATDVAFENTAGSQVNINSATVFSNKIGGYAGGAFGTYNASENAEFPEWIYIGDSDANRVLLKTSGGAGNQTASGSSVSGGLFGELGLSGGAVYTLKGTGLYVDRDATATNGGIGTSYGGIAGIVTQTSGAGNSLVIDTAVSGKQFKVDSRVNADKKTYYYGGIIGKIESDVYVQVANVDIHAYNPFGSGDGIGFGGVAGRVCSDSVLKVTGTVSLTTDSYGKTDKKIWEGGGIAGYTEAGSAIELSGTTDMSGVYYTDRYAVGLLVGYQENSLIYARGDGNGDGWKYIRVNRGDQLKDDANQHGDIDDIGNYGQVIRLKASADGKGLPDDLITMDPVTHKVTVKQSTTSLYDGGTAQISGTEDFALLAIAWQSHGYFSAWGDITTSNWSELYKKDIKLSGDVDLTGSGIYGLTRDNADDGNVYSGTFDGAGNTITLAIGELYGYRGNALAEKGSAGEVCRHTHQGIFAVASGATVSDLTIAGSINVNAMGRDRNVGDTKLKFYIGGFAGEVKGTAVVKADKVTLTEQITVSSVSTNRKVESVNAGGLYGGITDALTVELGKETGIVSKAVLCVADVPTDVEQCDYNNIYAGGVIGSIVGDNKTVTVNCYDVELAGETKSGDNATILPAGGLIGSSFYGTVYNTINIDKVVVNGQKVTASGANLTVSGGLLGYIWADVKVVFATPSSAGDHALTIDDATLTAAKATVGGLVYRSNGKWTVNDRGINMSKASFTAKNLGLLLGHMDVDDDRPDVNKKALYLEFTENWSTAYSMGNVTVGGSPAVFDEFAAYTAADAASITNNGTNGLISLATKDHAGVATTGEINTYVNRTDYGQAHKTNGCSRYYYNLDQVITGESTPWILNTPSRLLEWSVYMYVPSNLKGLMFSGRNLYNNNPIGSYSANDKAVLDMTGLSYYPVDVTGVAVTLKNADITFANETIESYDKDNKSTVGTSDEHSQHYMMHSGLFYNLTGVSTGDIESTVSNVAFAGTVGMANGGSGALCCGTVLGIDGGSTVYKLTMNTVILDGIRVANMGSYAPVLINLAGSNTTLDLASVKVSDDGYDGSSAAGSSLIGSVGSDTSTQISIIFSKMTLPDTKYTSGGKGIFNRATFLESFQYKRNGVGSGIYNFTKKEDWTGTTHSHNVTYGKEISNSSQYDGLQKWYYDKATYGNDKGLTTWSQDETIVNRHDFSGYLPYVATAYNEDNRTFEIMVNQRVSDLTDGCGTYGHPYELTATLDMTTVADYIATAVPKDGWKIRVTAAQTTYHTESGTGNDTVYMYNGTAWVEVESTSSAGDTSSADDTDDNWTEVSGGKTLTNKVMHRYILSAYYDIQGDSTSHTISVENFRGFGTQVYPFRGVITSTHTGGATVELSGASTANGFIPYSYGCVVRNVDIKYTGTGSKVTYNSSDIPTWNTNRTVAYYYTSGFWGGVIGCVMGGDNIIDNVSVDMADGWKLTLDGNRNYLIQTGGYVGSVSGGGVIFRNISDKSGLSDDHLAQGSTSGTYPVSVGGSATDTTATSLYVNPYVGRVLDGYAFSEGCEINNGTKTYKVNKLDTADTGSIVTTGSTKGVYKTEIKTAQGLLIFSAIVNSGGAAGSSSTANLQGTLAYSGKIETDGHTTDLNFGNGIYGKVRNATYEHIGQSADVAEADFNISVNDDTKTPGCKTIGNLASDLDSNTNAPYLVTKYSNPATFYVSGGRLTNVFETFRVAIELTGDTDYDMSSYGNGYQGISGRYISNATNIGSTSGEFMYCKPLLYGFNGNDHAIIADMQIKEYADDDYHGVSFGGVFNLLRTTSSTYGDAAEGSKYLVQNLAIKNTTITMRYYNAAGAVVDSSNLNDNLGKMCVSVGGFAGNTAQNKINGNDATTAQNASYVIYRYDIKDSVIEGPNAAGGFMGSTAMGDSYILGGIGLLYNATSSNHDWNSFGTNLVNCTYDNIRVTGGYYAGGFVGFMSNSSISYGYGSRMVKSSLSVTDAKYSMVGKNSVFTARLLNGSSNSAAGGVVGGSAVNFYVNDPEFAIHSGTVYTNKDKDLQKAVFENITASSKQDSAAVVGHIELSDCDIYGVSVKNTGTSDTITISGSANAGGVVGYVRLENTSKTMIIQDSSAENIKTKGATVGSGGILGGFGNSVETTRMTISNCQVTDSDIKDSGSDCSAGGIVGNIQGKDWATSRFQIDSCTVSGCDIGSSNASGWNGGLAGSMAWRVGQNLYIYDCTVKDTSVRGKDAGGLICSVTGTLYCSNVLLNKVTVTGGKTGAFADAAGSDDNHYKGLYVDGLSIKNSNIKNFAYNIGSFKLGTKGYIAFADYTNAVADKDTVGSDEKALLDIDSIAEPYVVTSPKSKFSVKSDESSAEEYLHGDGAVWTGISGNYVTTAEKIMDDGSSPAAGLFAYTMTGVSEFDFTGKVKTYNSNQTVKAATDFPVLQISGGDTSSISDYLDILTNGGYSNAVNCNPASAGDTTHVTASTAIYEYDSDNKTFVRKDGTPALRVSGNGTNAMEFKASTDFDNDMSRFTLLTVTWNSDTEHSYSVQVPIIVRRVLEIDFIATLGYGTHFRSLDYDNFTEHVLDSFGNPMTGYLTYVYNSALGKKVTYGWQNYVDGGGDMTLGIDKKVKFSTQLPVGTQLTLVDCQDPNRTSYYYTIEDSSENTISMSKFKRSDDETAFDEENIGKAIGAKVDKSDNGIFIQVDESGKPVGAADDGEFTKPSIYIEGNCYRLAETGEDTYQHYSVTVDEDNAKENYYLVVTMPKTDGISAVNGWLGTEVEVSIPHNVNYMLRNMKDTDPHSNSASTYQISDGYQQKLTETLEGEANSKALSTSDSIIKVSVRDEITFPNNQVYNPNDKLYQRFEGSLQTVVRDSEGKDKISYEQFPSGTTGKVRFYVYTIGDDGPSYYSYDGEQDAWNPEGNTKTPALEYTWISTGGNMELPFSTDGTVKNAVSLSGFRDKVKTGDTGNTTFYVEAVLDASIPAVGLDVIPVSTLVNGVPQNYAKLNYVARLSTEKTSLTYSSTKDTLTDTKVRYYQEDVKGADLVYEADDIDQLGINLLDLENNLDKDKKNAIIGTTARFDLSAMQNMDSVLRNSSGIRFELTLSRKSTDSGSEESYDSALADAEKYMNAKLISTDSGTVTCNNGTWTWTIPSTTYVENGKLKTSSVFDGSAFTQAINLFVDVSNIEDKDIEHFYSNYKVELKADILDADGESEVSDTDNIIYTLTKIKPEFVDKTGN